jgi:hypothetical protein
VARTFVALTAELGEPSGSASGAEPKRADASSFQWGAGIKTLICGGGSSHDFDRWFNKADVATLSEGGLASANYTARLELVLPALKDIDVLYLNNNQPFPGSDTHKAIFAHADAGKGLVLVHPALWYNWGNWTEYNRVLVGGGRAVTIASANLRSPSPTPRIP